MSYTITIPVDWLEVGGMVWVIEPASRTGYGKPHAFHNRVTGFNRTGFYYQYEPKMPIYHAEWSEIGKSVFETMEEAAEALNAWMKWREENNNV
jgi:hypothetical protein